MGCKPSDLPDEHVVTVRTRLGRTAADDVYTPKCRCDWTGKPITAGKTPQQNWQRAWDAADAHAESVAT